MIILKEYKITYYSKVELPSFKGLLGLNIDTLFEGEVKNPLLIFKPTSSIIYKGITDIFHHEVVKAQSIYELHTDGTISIDELYNLTKEAWDYLRSFLQGFDISKEIKKFPDPPLDSVRYSLEDILEKFHRKM